MIHEGLEADSRLFFLEGQCLQSSSQCVPKCMRHPTVVKAAEGLGKLLYISVRGSPNVGIKESSHLTLSKT
jgi:hypothetical protein